MYRGMPGPGPGPQPGPPANNRLAELLDQVRAELDQQLAVKDAQLHEMNDQSREMELIHSRVMQLQQTHMEMKKGYEAEIARLRHELEQRGGAPQGPHAGPSQPPPAIGHGPANLFQGIMTGNGQGGQGLAPPPEQQGAPGMPPQLQNQPPPGLNAPLGPPHNPFGGYGQPQGPGINGYGPHAAQSNASPGPGGNRALGPGQFGGPATTPLQSQANPYTGSPAIARPTPPPNQVGRYQAPDFQYSQADIERIGNQLSDYDPDKLPPHLKRQGDDWHAVFNPNQNVRRRLDVELVHNLVHQSVVCCVRFSGDGRFVATGCNRSAQIYDVVTGQEVCVLRDPSTNQDGDLYIRSVCFSPDGRYLATGAEDKIIRVWDIREKVIRYQFSGHEQDIYSLDFASDGRHIASGSGDRTIRIWDIQGGGDQCILNLQIEDGVTTVAMSPDNRYVAAGSLDKSVRIWDVHTGQLVERTEGEQGHTDSVYSVAFSPRGNHLVSGSLDKTIRMWKLNTNQYVGATGRGDCVRTFQGHKDFVLSVALTPDGSWVMSGSKDRGVQFWDPDTGHAQLMLQGHKNSVISVAPSPATAPQGMGGLFATGSGDMKARIWRYTDYRGGAP